MVEKFGRKVRLEISTLCRVRRISDKTDSRPIQHALFNEKDPEKIWPFWKKSKFCTDPNYPESRPNPKIFSAIRSGLAQLEQQANFLFGTDSTFFEKSKKPKLSFRRTGKKMEFCTGHNYP